VKERNRYEGKEEHRTAGFAEPLSKNLDLDLDKVVYDLRRGRPSRTPD
jgi:hypothetical protein